MAASYLINRAALEYRNDELKSPYKAVLIAIALHTNTDGLCWPGVDMLAAELGNGRRTILRGLKKLEELGLVQQEGRIGHTKKYRLNLEALGLTKDALAIPKKQPSPQPARPQTDELPAPPQPDRELPPAPPEPATFQMKMPRRYTDDPEELARMEWPEFWRMMSDAGYRKTQIKGMYDDIQARKKGIAG